MAGRIDFNAIIPKVRDMLARGFQQQEIGDELGISGASVSKAVALIRNRDAEGTLEQELLLELDEALTTSPTPDIITAQNFWIAGSPNYSLSLPDDDALRGELPMFDGLIAYFPNALAEVSRVSKIGNDQHNPGQPMHWDRSKSQDHENKILRHLADVGKRDGRGVRHAARLAWRALALLQEEMERDEGLPPSRASKNRGW